MDAALQSQREGARLSEGAYGRGLKGGGRRKGAAPAGEADRGARV